MVAVLLLIGCTGEQETAVESGQSLDFASLRTAHPRLADEHLVEMRDGSALRVRSYGHDAPIDLIFVHGSGAYNHYLSQFAATIADSGVAVVHTPDLRGHGAAPERRGDIDYIDQLEDDLVDLIGELVAEHPERKRVLGGHSSGGGLAIRFAGGPHGDLVDGHLLLAPFLQHDAPTVRPNSGGWAKPRLGRIIGLTMLNAVGIRAWNDATVLDFDLPVDKRSGLETPSYTFRMMTGFNPRNYRDDLAALDAPTLVVVGARDEAFVAERFPEVFAAHAPAAQVVLVPEVGHLALVDDTAVAARSIAFLGELADAPDAEGDR